MSETVERGMPACSVLIVDDNPDNLKVLGTMLREQGHEVRIAHDGIQAIESTEKRPPDIILLDIHMPKMDGYEVCRRLKADPRLCDVPVIFLSALNETFNKVQAYQCGGADYVTKPFQIEEVRVRMAAHLRTRRLLAESDAAFRSSEERYRSFMMDLPVGAFRCSPDHESRFLFANPALVDMLGYDSAEALPAGETMAAHCGVEPCRRFTDELVSRGHVEGHALRFTRGDGATFDARVWAHTRGSGETACVEGVIIDVTEQLSLEARLRQAQRMEAIGTLAGGIAHDFNNILSAVFAYLHLAMSDVGEDTEVHEYLSEIHAAACRARDLVAQILAFSRQAERERRPFRPQTVIREALRLLRASIPPTIEIVEEIDNARGLVLADPTEIHQIIMNLCSNAYHAMRDSGGVLTVRLDQMQPDLEDAGQDAAPQTGPCVRLQVEDTGHGMNQEIQARIFEPYFTTKERGEGTGLGLATVHGIVKDLNGSIRVRSEEGAGSIFSVLLPCVPEKDRMSESEEPRAAELAGNERILLVEDEEQIAKSTKTALERLGYRLTTQSNGSQALDLLSRDPEQFDIVITDQMMPRMTGTELASRLMEIRPELPVILCSGFGEAIRDTRTRNDNIRDYVMKPIIASDLAKSIRKVLGTAADEKD